MGISRLLAYSRFEVNQVRAQMFQALSAELKTRTAYIAWAGLDPKTSGLKQVSTDRDLNAKLAGQRRENGKLGKLKAGLLHGLSTRLSYRLSYRKHARSSGRKYDRGN